MFLDKKKCDKNIFQMILIKIILIEKIKKRNFSFKFHSRQKQYENIQIKILNYSSEEDFKNPEINL